MYLHATGWTNGQWIERMWMCYTGSAQHGFKTELFSVDHEVTIRECVWERRHEEERRRIREDTREREDKREIEKASALKLFSALTDWMDGKGHQHHCNQQQAAYNNNPANQQHCIWSRQLLDILLLQSVVRFSKIELRQSDSFQRLLKM